MTVRVLLAMPLLLAAAAAANQPRTEAVAASFAVTTIEAPATFACTGLDGEYVQLKDAFSGQLMSDDARLNGTLTVDANILVNTTTGFGAGSGTWDVRDALGHVLVSGHFKGAVSNMVEFKGFAWGATPTGGGDKFFGSLSVIVGGDVAVGTIGAPLTAVPNDPAVFQSGSCIGSGPD